MKKKMLTGLGMAVVCTAMFLNGSINMDKGTNDAALADLVNAPTANAECVFYDFWEGFGGDCIAGDFCAFRNGSLECDPWKM